MVMGNHLSGSVNYPSRSKYTHTELP